MALRPAPKRKSVDYEKLDDLQKEIFGSEQEEVSELPSKAESEDESTTKARPQVKVRANKSAAKTTGNKKNSKTLTQKKADENSLFSRSVAASKESAVDSERHGSNSLAENLKDLETIAARIASSKAGQGRNTTRPFSLPRTLIIDTTRLKAKFRTIDEQFTQNVIIDFLLREALAAATPENYRDLRVSAFEFVKRPEETTRRSLTVTEDVVYQMSELKAGINLETGRKYSNDEIFSTLLAIGVSWLYRNGVLT